MSPGHRSRVALLVALIAATQVYADVGSSTSMGVEWQQQRLAVDVDSASYRDLLQVIASKTDVEVQGLANLQGTASIRFAGQSLRDGLAAVLAEFNYVLVEEPARGALGKSMVVYVLGPRLQAGGSTSATEPTKDRLEPVSPVPSDADTYRDIEHLAEQGNVQALREAALSGAVAWSLAVQKLARLDAREAQRLAIDAAGSHDAGQRTVALQILGGLESDEAVTVLGAALMDPEPAVRHAAMVGLTGQTSPRSVEFLHKARQELHNSNHGGASGS